MRCRGRLEGIVADGELDAHLETERAQDLGLAQVCFEVQGRELEAEAAADIGTELIEQSSRRQRCPGCLGLRRRWLRLRLEIRAEQTVGEVRDARRRIRALDTAQVCAQAVFGRAHDHFVERHTAVGTHERLVSRAKLRHDRLVPARALRGLAQVGDVAEVAHVDTPRVHLLGERHAVRRGREAGSHVAHKAHDHRVAQMRRYSAHGSDRWIRLVCGGADHPRLVTRPGTELGERIGVEVEVEVGDIDPSLALLLGLGELGPREVMQLRLPVRLDELWAQEREAVWVRWRLGALQHRAVQVTLEPVDVHGAEARHVEHVHAAVGATQTLAVDAQAQLMLGALGIAHPVWGHVQRLADVPKELVEGGVRVDRVRALDAAVRDMRCGRAVRLGRSRLGRHLPK